MTINSQKTPEARKRGLLVEELEDETLVYDLKTHAAHCLNRSAALVWRECDGKTTVAEMATLLGEVGLEGDESLVWMALDRLDKAGLLLESATPPGSQIRLTRKEMLRAVAAATGMTLLIPAVDSVVAPLAAQAASCLTGAQCRALRAPNCTGLPNCNNARRCCTRVTRRNQDRCRMRPC